MDHVCVSLTDLMNRYNPPVPKSRYKVSRSCAGVPVITVIKQIVVKTEYSGGRAWGV